MTIRTKTFGLAAIAAIALTACGGGGTAPSGDALPKAEAPAGQKWSQVVSATQDGFVMGNPDAPLKLVEFASPTCGACAAFANASNAELKGEFVDSGRVSVEIRPFMLNPFDLAIASIAACGGTERFFPLLDNVFATQGELMQTIQAGNQEAGQAALQSQNFTAFASAFGIDTFFAARGMAASDISTCLANTEGVTRWQESTQRNQEQFEISGTPTFLLNGEVLAGASSWDQVKERLQAAGAR